MRNRLVPVSSLELAQQNTLRAEDVAGTVGEEPDFDLAEARRSERRRTKINPYYIQGRTLT